MMTTVGFLPLARPTFDVPYAEETADRALSVLTNSVDADVVGDAVLAMDTDAASARAAQLNDTDPEAVVVFQATFADSTLIRAASSALDCPIVLWAVSEERTGGRLRLNSFCGINLAAFVLARDNIDYRWVYRSVDEPEAADDLREAIESKPDVAAGTAPTSPSGAGEVASLDGLTVGLVGQRPDGFEPCDFDPEVLAEVFGVSVDRVELDDWFVAADNSSDEDVAAVRSGIEAAMTGLDDVDQESLTRSLRIYLGLSSLAETRSWNGVATRCWPECFTEFGGAACAGNSMLTSRGIPGCCEADVYGNVTALLLQQLSNQPPFVADLVDLDRASNTAAFWHCGLAPKEMAPDDEKSHATIHSNRQKPLLNEFRLRPGRITIARLSQSQNQNRLLIGSGEMLDAPLPFSGTSGVARLDASTDDVLGTIMANGLEHHYGIAYGDFTDELRSYAGSVGIDVVTL